MHLIEIFLPLADNQGKRLDRGLYERVSKELTERFGGITSFGRAPAHGTFKEDGVVVHDDIVVYEVIARQIDRDWWTGYRKNLEELFAQDEILIRASPIERL